MAVRFRYRSSPRFESLDLAGTGAVSVRDLRARILGSALRSHFDLLISDADSNRPLDDDALLIPAGSDFVVKRVPIASDGGGGGGESSIPHKTCIASERAAVCVGVGWVSVLTTVLDCLIGLMSSTVAAVVTEARELRRCCLLWTNLMTPAMCVCWSRGRIFRIMG